ncbi:MAG: glycosyltransferase [Acidimicrobiia bacterium]|jgi:GT2 family glycosyltransferase
MADLHASVMAVVLTYDAPDAARRCLASIREQHAGVDAVLVVDNASEPPFVTDPAAGSGVRVLRLLENTGPAGGYAAGLRTFLASDASWVWLVDDDSTPRPGALAAQLRAAATRTEPTAFLSTMVDRDTGAEANTHGWCGVLIPRVIVEAVGTPMEALFWWAEDTEYLQWRIPRAGFALERCDDAVVDVSLRRAERAKPAWKFYYETRNQVYFRLRVQRQPADGPRRRHLTVRVRSWRAARTVAKLGGRAVLREPDGRARKLAMVVRGAADGLRGRLGRTVAVDLADRPLAPGTGRTSPGRVDPEEPFDLDEA